MTDQPVSPDDDPRDAYLLAALRHAPDRDLTPPPQLTAAILDHAQRAVRAPRVARVSGGWRDMWARLWQPAPMAAFGTLAVASLIGVLWVGRELPDATPSLRPERVAAAPAASTAAPPGASTPAPAAPPAVEPAAPSSKSAVRGETALGRDLPMAKEMQRQAPPPRDGRDALRTGKLDEQAANITSSGQPETPPPAPVVPAPVARESVPLHAEARRDLQAKALADSAAPSALASARGRSEVAALGGAASAPASPLARANAELDAASGSDATRVRWRVTSGRFVGHEGSQGEWWAALMSATEGRWLRAASVSEAVAVELLIDGLPRGNLVFEPQAVVWRDANGLVWRAPVAAETVREWQGAIARW